MAYYAIVGAELHPVDGPAISRGTLLWENGKITAVGESVELPRETEVIEGEGLVVTPGLIDAHTHLGIQEEIYEYEGDDLNEVGESAVTPEMRAIDGINPYDIAFRMPFPGE